MNMRFRAAFESNKCVRFLAYPYVCIRNQLRIWKFSRSEDSKYIRSLRNKYKGAACFVIGNGPSLLPEDLDKLSDAGMICFGVNRIYHIFQYTTWRPTYYLCLDSYLAAAEIESIRHAGDFPKFINYDTHRLGRKKEDQIYYMCSHRKFPINPMKNTAKMLSNDPAIYTQKMATIVSNAIELAVYMGFSTIYLLGVDNNYTLKQVNGKVYKDPNVKESYFKGMKVSNSKVPSVQNVEYMNSTFEICKEFADEHYVKIYNATRGGKLEMFERVDFDKVITQNKI